MNDAEAIEAASHQPAAHRIAEHLFTKYGPPGREWSSLTDAQQGMWLADAHDLTMTIWIDEGRA